MSPIPQLPQLLLLQLLNTHDIKSLISANVRLLTVLLSFYYMYDTEGYVDAIINSIRFE